MLYSLLSTPTKQAVLGSFMVMTLVILVLYQSDEYRPTYSNLLTENDTAAIYNESSQYLIESNKCKIPNLDPFNSQVMRFYHPEKYTPCTKKQLLSYTTKSGDDLAVLHIDEQILPSYGKKVTCCYANVTRGGTPKNPDDGIKVSKCVAFTNNVTVAGFVHVECKNSKKKRVYENVHAPVLLTETVTTKMETLKNTTPKPFSVLFVGIDSISRLNLIRSLPQTYQFLEDNNWVSLKGYNKMGDNTFPNLMAILTGFNPTQAYGKCKPLEISKLDQCPFAWFDYRKFGYITGYAEDETSINTFNYHKKGFTQPPTDYYFRPYVAASEKLKIVRKDSMNYCTGPETAGERILNLAKDFTFTFKSYPTFGFFWMNTFSHNEVNSPTGLDLRIKVFLEDLSFSGALEDTIVVFLSDHGIRFGDIRYTVSGWLEERLPYIYISIPKRFQEEHSVEYKNLQVNTRRLTTPYDLHMTLQHILVLSGLNHTVRPSGGCPTCGSLFSVVPEERSCEDAAVEQHWCTCGAYSPTVGDTHNTTAAVAVAIEDIHRLIRKERQEKKCAKYQLRKIISSNISEPSLYKNDTYLLIVFETKPKAVFEATLRYYEASANSGVKFNLTTSVSRLDKYSSHSACVDNAELKKYCYCL